MSQHNNKEETELQFTGTLNPTLCVNNCGLYGNPATNNMCTSCFRSKIRPNSPSASAVNDKPRKGLIRTAEIDSDGRAATVAEEERTVGEGRRPTAAVNRCLKCRKRVGLTGFRCRCGDLFCGDHRYSDRHSCDVDYKAVARERIQRENPVVRAAKIVRI